MSDQIETIGKQVAGIIKDAGGRIVGRTRLQKITFLLELANKGPDFDFYFHHYGPYSDELSDATVLASALNLIKEDIEETSWGGKFSIYELNNDIANDLPSFQATLVQKMANADSIVLELAATAAYFAMEKNVDPWLETQKRKTYKAQNNRLEQAKSLYNELREIEPALPQIA